jgi:hypothetical protein
MPKGTETLFVPSDDGLTLNIMLNKTKNIMRDKFFTYQPTNNNCQEFVLQLLVSNGLNTDSLEEFVIQDVGKLFEYNPQFRKIVTTVTDTGSIASTSLDKYQTNELLRKPSTGYSLFSSSNTKFNNILNRSIPEFFRNSFTRFTRQPTETSISRQPLEPSKPKRIPQYITTYPVFMENQSSPPIIYNRPEPVKIQEP